MSTRRVYEIRQAILGELAGIYPGGRVLDRLLVTGDLVALKVTREEAFAELAVLESGAFVLDLRPQRDPYYKITYTGLLQIRRETALDETVWGEAAL